MCWWKNKLLYFIKNTFPTAYTRTTFLHLCLHVCVCRRGHAAAAGADSVPARGMEGADQWPCQAGPTLLGQRRQLFGTSRAPLHFHPLVQVCGHAGFIEPMCPVWVEGRANVTLHCKLPMRIVIIIMQVIVHLCATA